jgi:hypothetical protein
MALYDTDQSFDARDIGRQLGEINADSSSDTKRSQSGKRSAHRGQLPALP